LLNRKMLKVELVLKDRSLVWLAKELSLSKTTIYRKMEDGSFTIGEAQRICDLLGIDDPLLKCSIFFANDVPKVEQAAEVAE